MDFAIPLFEFNKKLQVLWLLFKYSFLQNREVSLEEHPSGSYQVWIDTAKIEY